jgi:hypothetical protein
MEGRKLLQKLPGERERHRSPHPHPLQHPALQQLLQRRGVDALQPAGAKHGRKVGPAGAVVLLLLLLLDKLLLNGAAAAKPGPGFGGCVGLMC